MVITVGHGETEPTHHIKLSKGSDEVGLMCVGPTNQRIPDIQVQPYPPRASQIREGKAKHSDKSPPFVDISLADFSGGLGQLHHDDDTSRYLDGYMMETSNPSRAMLQGRPTYTKGIRDFNEYFPGITDDRCYWGKKYSGQDEDTVWRFTSTAAYNADKVLLYMRKVGSPTGNITVSLLSSADAVLKTVTINSANLPYHSSYWVECDWSGVQALTDATVYKLKINYAGGDSDNYIEVWHYLASGDPNGETWHFIYRLLDDTAAFNILPFEYRNMLYIITQPDDRSASKMYLIGYRGLADANTGALTTLIDGTQSWTVDALIGYEARIVAGPGSEEAQSWREITDNDATTVTVDPAWKVEHTVDTEYIIISDTWKLIKTFSYYVEDVSVADRVIYLAYGNDEYVTRLRYGNDDQVWTEEASPAADEMFKATKLLNVPIMQHHSPRKIFDFYAARNNLYFEDRVYPNNILRMLTPPYWGKPYVPTVQVLDHKAWLDVEKTNIIPYADRMWAAFEVAVGFGTGVIARRKLSPPLDISDVEALLIDVSVTEAYAAGELSLRMTDNDGNEQDLPFPAIPLEDDMHDTFTHCELPLHAAAAAPTGGYMELHEIQSFKLRITANKGAHTIRFGEMGLVGITRSFNAGMFEIGFGERINNMIEYGGGAGQVTRKPWVGTTKNVYYIEDEALKPIYLAEIEELEHERNCEGMVVNDSYLYFNIEERIMRYYSGQLDNIGPDVDYGLPKDRRGIPCTMSTFPGKVIAGYDGSDDNFSHVMYRRSHGWHEQYRAPVEGKRIRKVHNFARMSTINQLFVSEGADVLYLPMSVNSETEDNFPYAYHGHIQTSRIYGSIRETRKYFHSLEIIQEEHEVASSGLYAGIRCYYRTSNLDDWTLIDDFTTVPNEENLIGTYDIGGTWIQFLIELETQVAQYSPVLVTVVLDCLERTPVKNQYRYRFILNEDYDECLNEENDDVTGVTKKAQLDTWTNQELPLTLNSNSAYEDGKIVTIEPTQARMVEHEIDGSGKEVRIYEITFLEIE